MEKILCLSALAVLLIAASTSCKKDVTDVTLNETSIYLDIGEMTTLTATILPEKADNKTITWTSSNTFVATVMPNGLVTGLSKGVASIVATTQDGGKSARCEVTVEKVTAKEVELNKNQLSLPVGYSEVLTAKVLPSDASNKSVTWKSSNTNVATVNNYGLVNAISTGTTTITVTTVSGNKTANCNLEVISVFPVSEVRLNKNQLTFELSFGYEYGTLTATVFPENAANKKVTWKSSNDDIASVSNDGKVMAKEVGTAIITVTTQDGNKTANCNVTVEEGRAFIRFNKDKSGGDVYEMRVGISTYLFGYYGDGTSDYYTLTPGNYTPEYRSTPGGTWIKVPNGAYTFLKRRKYTVGYNINGNFYITDDGSI
jgi:uncharacterized protein YjdB